MAMPNIAQIAKLPGIAGLTWKQLGVLAAFGVVIGLVLALTASIRVS